MARLRTSFTAILAAVLCIATSSPRVVDATAQLARRGPAEGARPSLDGVLSTYIGGDFDVVQRTFLRSLDLQERLRLTRPRELERWLGSWDRGKALLLLEFARTSANVAPHFVQVIVGAGRRYLAFSPDMNFVQAWHRAAAGLLLGASDPAHLEEHVTNVPKDARLLLMRAMAQERRCWGDRPSLDRPAMRIDALLEKAGVRVPDDSGGPLKSGSEAALAKHSACLREALSRFEAAAAVEEVKAEALVRGGWILFQDGRPKEAIEWLDAAEPHDDRELEYWHALFRGRALEALARSRDAVDDYRAALALYPHAQSAGLGLSFSLIRLDRTKEADEVSRSVREAGALTPDPWLHYIFGDRRFAPRLIESLRTVPR